MNTDQPWKNWPFKVFFSDTYKDPKGKRLDVFTIELQDVDVQWFGLEAEAFQAWHTAPTEVLVKMPTGSFTFLRDVPTETRGKKDAGSWEERIEDGVNEARNNMIKLKPFEYFRLLFTQELNNGVFTPGAVAGKLEPDVVPIYKKIALKLKDGTVVEGEDAFFANIDWKIAAVEPTDRDANPNPEPNVNELGKKFAALKKPSTTTTP